VNPVVISITLRQLLSRRRTILLLLLGVVMILVALALRLGLDDIYWDLYASRLLDNFGLATLMPLVALLFGTSSIGAELDEGTAVYILAKPMSRSSILLAKLVVAIACAVVVTCIPMALAGLVAGGEADLVIGFTVAGAFGAVVYCALFVFLSLLTGRALVIGLGYVLIWEGVLAGLFAGSRTFSVRQYALSVADALSDARPEVLDAPLPLATALVMAGVVTVVATVLAWRRLTRIEIAGETA
jgi:ABC-2 type transport system permease protein